MKRSSIPIHFDDILMLIFLIDVFRELEHSCPLSLQNLILFVCLGNIF